MPPAIRFTVISAAYCYRLDSLVSGNYLKFSLGNS